MEEEDIAFNKFAGYDAFSKAGGTKFSRTSA